MTGYKESTFWERFLHYVKVTDPTTLIYSDERILAAKKWLDEHPAEDNDDATDSNERNTNNKIVQAAIHPVTGEIIPKLFRVSAISPVNIPIVFAMITCPASNIPGTLFLHWFNQSYNTACNYANRSGADQSMEQLMKAYGLAVTSACTLAYGMGKVAAKFGSKMRGLGILIPLLATSAANVSNIAFTRMDEISNGSPLFNDKGQVVGNSKYAGIQGVTQTAMTRCVLVPCACLLIPPVIMGGLGKIRLVPSNPRLKILLELGVIYGALQAALPAALAVFPQTAKIPATSLEPQFHNLKDDTGRSYEYFYANKGL